jgi:hypothetical protein
MLDAIEHLGRHTGWVASHGEVAALVEELAGKELARRREAVAKAQGLAEESAIDRSSTPSGLSIPGVPPPRRGRTALAAGAAALLLGAGTIVAMRSGGRGARGVESAATSSAGSVPPREALSSSPSTEARPPAPTARPEASTGPGAAAVGRRTYTPRPAPTHTAAAPAPPQAAAPPAEPPPAAPPGITTTNPYR